MREMCLETPHRKRDHSWPGIDTFGPRETVRSETAVVAAPPEFERFQGDRPTRAARVGVGRAATQTV
jgi:hypothetical protein